VPDEQQPDLRCAATRRGSHHSAKLTTRQPSALINRHPGFLVSEVIAGSQVNRPPGGCLGALERARKRVEAGPVFVRVDERQDRPTVRVTWGWVQR
jgi:hypothetical protein